MALNYNSFIMTSKDKRTLMLLLVVLFGLMGMVFYRTVLIIIFIPFFYKRAEKIYSEMRIKKRQEQLLLQFKDLLYSMSASFATGRHMSEALEEACYSLGEIYKSSDYILEEVTTMIKEIQAAGKTDVKVFEDFAERSGLQDIRDFAQVFRACRDTGGDIIKAMNRAASVISEKITIENEIRLMVSQKKFEGRIITVMPVAVIVFLRIMSPDYLDIMYSTLAGRVLMTMAVSVTGISYYMIERITSIEV